MALSLVVLSLVVFWGKSPAPAWKEQKDTTLEEGLHSSFAAHVNYGDTDTCQSHYEAHPFPEQNTQNRPHPAEVSEEAQ